MRLGTPEEIAWCNKLRRLMRKMPDTMKLVADGDLHAVPVDCSTEKDGAYGGGYQAIKDIANMGPCEGGDPWN